MRFKFLPNLLTLTRIALCPIIIHYLVNTKYSTAFILFSVAALTDGLDGYAARKLHATTALGSILDPLSDKVYLISLFITLMFLGNCPFWFLGLVISVTLLQGIGFFVIHLPKNPMGVQLTPLKIGKWNTTLQLFWIGCMILDFSVKKSSALLSPGFVSWPEFIVYVVLAVFQLGVILQYFFHHRLHLAPEIKAFFPIHTSSHR